MILDKVRISQKRGFAKYLIETSLGNVYNKNIENIVRDDAVEAAPLEGRILKKCERGV